MTDTNTFISKLSDKTLGQGFTAWVLYSDAKEILIDLTTRLAETEAELATLRQSRAMWNDDAIQTMVEQHEFRKYDGEAAFSMICVVRDDLTTRLAETERERDAAVDSLNAWLEQANMDTESINRLAVERDELRHQLADCRQRLSGTESAWEDVEAMMLGFDESEDADNGE